MISSARRPSDPLVSVVVPCYNEEAVILETAQRLSHALDAMNVRYEVIYVDDGSRDDTPVRLCSIKARDERVRVISLSRNFGHQMAVTAGVDHARGDAVVLIDADLQDPPELIAQMLDKWREGYDVVYGVRESREGETPFKLATARAFYRLLNRMSEVPIPLDTGDFRLMDRCVIDALKMMPERHRFIRGMVSWVGFNQIALPYHRHARFAGESKYPLRKMVAFATDGLISFSARPLRFSTQLGMLSSTAAMFGILYALGMRIFTLNWVSGWTMMMIAVLFLGGVQLVSLGIIGEYIGRIYSESKRRPLYLSSELTLDGEEPAREPALSRGYLA